MNNPIDPFRHKNLYKKQIRISNSIKISLHSGKRDVRQLELTESEEDNRC
jgi:hypothetical protein